MTIPHPTPPTHPHAVPVPHPTTTGRVGLVLAGLLAVVDLGTLLGMAAGQLPPAVALPSVVLAVVTLAALRPAWRGSGAATTTVVVSRLLSAVSGLLVLAVDAPAGAAIGAVAGGALTVVAAALVWSGRSGATAGGRR